MAKNMIYTADEMNAILKSAWDSELKKIHVRTDRKPRTGGMSNGVFEVVLNGSKRRWALKVIDAESFARLHDTNASGTVLPLLTQKFQQAEEEITRELKIHKDLSDLRNRYFVQAVKTYETDGLHLIRMPYYDGLAAYDGAPEESAIKLGTDICQALLALHFDDGDMGGTRHGVLLHGDIKPQNIFYEKEHGTVHFKLGDFGSVRHLGEPCRSRSEGYYAPEVKFGSKNVQPSADLFSLGLVLYWYVCGKDNALEHEAWEKRCAGKEPRKPRDCSDQLWEVILDATKTDPEGRIQTASELLERLQNVESKKLATREKENQELRKTNETQSAILGAEAVIGIAAAAGALVGFLSEKIFDLANDYQNAERLNIKEVGGWYKGAVAENLPSGKGTYHYSDGSSHTGNWAWETGQMTRFFDDDETAFKFSGMLCDGAYYGFCIMEAGDDWAYRGEVKNNCPYGKGCFLFQYRGEIARLAGTWGFTNEKRIKAGAQSRIYKGMLRNSRPNGWGHLKIPGVGTFRGILCDGKLCVGCFEWENGAIYDGEWLHDGDEDWPDGKGLHLLADGSRYEGQIKRGCYEGYGIKTYPDGSTYKGMWQQDKRCGEGDFTDADGKTIHAVWENDRPVKIL